MRKGSYVHIIQIASPTEAKLSSAEKLNGVLLDIDTIYSIDTHESFWSEFDNQLAEMHQASKEIFFTLLDDDTITLLQPEY